MEHIHWPRRQGTDLSQELVDHPRPVAWYVALLSHPLHNTNKEQTSATVNQPFALQHPHLTTDHQAHTPNTAT